MYRDKDVHENRKDYGQHWVDWAQENCRGEMWKSGIWNVSGDYRTKGSAI